MFKVTNAAGKTVASFDLFIDAWLCATLDVKSYAKISWLEDNNLKTHTIQPFGAN